jgi:putative tricarboxylic transport membrane protein
MILTIHKEKAGAFLFLVFCVAYGMATYNIEVMFYAEEGDFNARTLPYALCFFGIVVSLALLLLPPATESEGKDSSLYGAFKGLDWKKVMLLVVTMVLYGLTIKLIGFILSTILFLIAGFRILGERRIRYLLLVSVPLVLGFWLIMTQLLEVYLASGSLFSFLGGGQ